MKVKIFSETSENTTGQSVTTQMNRISSTAAVRITNLAENTLHFTVQTTKVIHEFQQWYISFVFILASYVRQFRREVSTQGKKVSKSLFCHSTSSATWNYLFHETLQTQNLHESLRHSPLSPNQTSFRAPDLRENMSSVTPLVFQNRYVTAA